MQCRRINDAAERTYAVIFERGDESPGHLRRRHDADSGLALIRFD